jgi:hypothetical protein
MFLFAIAGLAAVTADFACLEDVCAPDMQQAQFRSMDEVRKFAVETLDQALLRSGVTLSDAQRLQLTKTGQLTGVVKLDRPVKHPNGTVEMPAAWLPEIPEGHPWRLKLTPADDAFYSFVEERIIKSRLYDPTNPDHAAAIDAYLRKANSSSPDFVHWTYAGGRTECPMKKNDAAGTGFIDATPDF